MNVTAALSAGVLRRRLTARLADAFAREGRAGTAALDVRLLVAHALDIDPARLALCDDQPVDAPTEMLTTALVERRLAGEPVARIVGRSAFFGLEFEIGPDTLVPRSDSEIVVEAALAFVDRVAGRDRPLAVLDLGTGSGALILALLSQLPRANGVAVDIAAGALAVARNNAERLKLDGRTRFVLADWGKALIGGFDIVLANPPYIESGTIAGLQVEVALHDPHLALDGGADGLDAHRAILADLDRMMAPGGRGFVEIGFRQAGVLAQLAESQGFSTTLHRDLGGIERVAELRRSAEGDDAEAEAIGAKMKIGLGNRAPNG
jgi:release factor glutamine methyltransferase